MKQKGQRGEALYWLDTEELEDGIHFSECLKTMSKERQRKVESCLLMKDKKLSLGAGILMDRGLMVCANGKRWWLTGRMENLICPGIPIFILTFLIPAVW